MHSKKLNQIIRLTLDRAAVQGPVNRRDIAEQVYQIVRDDDDYWSLADKREAYMTVLQSGVTDAMNEPMSEHYLQTNLPAVPKQFLNLLAQMPTYLCINARLGQHVLAIKATQEDWAANSRIKRAIGEQIIVKADLANDIRLALAAAGANSLEELTERKAA